MPMTSTLVPGVSLGSASLIAWYGVSAASDSGAASRGSRSPSGTSSRVCGTSMYSAMPPSRPRPPPAAPSSAERSHSVSSVLRHARQRPQPHGP